VYININPRPDTGWWRHDVDSYACSPKRRAEPLSSARGVHSACRRRARLRAMSAQHALEDLTGAALIGLVFSAMCV
jgi:hypothetical protein